MLLCELEGVSLPFYQLVVKLAGETSYSIKDRSCEWKRLLDFISAYLIPNPNSPGDTKRAKKLSNWYDKKPGRAYSNHEIAPIGQKEILLCKISHHTMCIRKDYLTDVTLRIIKCHDVRFYLCASIKNVRNIFQIEHM